MTQELTDEENEFVEKMAKVNGFEFMKKTSKGVYSFRRWSEKSLKDGFAYFIKGECAVCKKAHFKRRTNKKATMHLDCKPMGYQMGFYSVATHKNRVQV